jgi:ankyrin repeat protein
MAYVIIRINGNTHKQDNWSPLHYASCFGFAEIVDVLYDCGAKIDAIDNVGHE